MSGSEFGTETTPTLRGTTKSTPFCRGGHEEECVYCYRKSLVVMSESVESSGRSPGSSGEC